MTLKLTSTESQAIATPISALFSLHIGSFNGSKYPDAVYANLIRSFSLPGGVQGKDISDALRWKYGHWNKSNFPTTHSRLIARISLLWPKFVASVPGCFNSTFNSLRSVHGVPYITAAFLTHLTHPAQVHIIDQHNFRAMNYFMKGVRPGWIGKAVPSNFADLENVAEFIAVVLPVLNRLNPIARSARDLDKFLMAFGKSIK